MLIRVSVDQVMWCQQQSVNHQRLLCNLHCATTVVLREQLNFKSAVIRSKRSSCYKRFSAVLNFKCLNKVHEFSASTVSMNDQLKGSK